MKAPYTFERNVMEISEIRNGSLVRCDFLGKEVHGVVVCTPKPPITTTFVVRFFHPLHRGGETQRLMRNELVKLPKTRSTKVIKDLVGRVQWLEREVVSLRNTSKVL